MKKWILASVLFLALTPWCRASNEPSLVYQVGIGSITTNVITVSTYNNTNATNQMDNPQLAGRVVLEIDNMDASANLWCLPVSSASFNSSNTGVGRKILPGGSWIVSVADGVIANPGIVPPVRTLVKFYCISDAASATKAAVTQMY